ncbi:MAG: thiamine pyrophosphate-binding protein [Gammaproteobacteria bacterium]|nr:thiamine pyrophosphate-binding protein [Gammaproteobacteria bacterium]MDH5800010.1 thiamine pyrophosphate-binding protein [Gammaproteobacteria bacterium]
MNISVSKLIVNYMERLGIDTIFGMPGAHILPVYDGLYDSQIKSVLAKHEQGAAFMASGYARDSGKIGACIATAGPGATNLITGIANAYVDKQPVLAITGETSTHIFGRGGLQESSGEGGSIDQNILFKGITRYSRMIERTDYLGNVLNRASNILLSSNPGPVLLSLPFNVQKEQVDASILDDIKTERNPHAGQPESSQFSQAIESLTDLIVKAEHPIIIAGYGCVRAGCQQELTELSELMSIPVTTSLKGKGAVNETSAYALGSMGVTSYGNARQYICDEADLLLVLGAGFNERTSYLWQKELLKDKKIAQVDIDESQLEKVFKADVAIQGDIKQVISGVLNNIKRNKLSAKDKDNILQAVDNLKTDIGQDAETFNQRFDLVKRFFNDLERAFPRGIRLFDDNIIFAQNFFNVSTENSYYPNTGISSLGYSIPAAIGAQFAEQKPTFSVIGDGGFQMCCMEIMTAVNYRIPLNIIMFNNSTMGLIRKNQHQQYNERYLNCDFENPDYAFLARSFGIKHKRIENADDLDGLFDELDFSKDINLVEIMIDKDAFPNYFSKR